ncbi:MAG: hypothetical protein K8R11_07145 [Methanococcoides sp.]|nr:hypothetical protein [Methanococcoides sp.]
MTSVGQKFSKFLTNIQLTDKQREDARTKYNGICKKLHDKYYSTTYDGSTKFLAGSYGKKTAISPPSDVDVIFIMPNSEFLKYSSHNSNGQSNLLRDIKNVLLEKYPNTDIRGSGQVVMVNFNSYNVELVPGFLTTDNTKYLIPDTHDGGKWKTTNPKSEIENINSSNKLTNGNTIKLIKMIKAWKHNCNVPIKSLVVELTVIDFLSTYEHQAKGSNFYDWMTRDYFKYLLTKVSSYSYIPETYERIPYGDSWESKTKTALSATENALKRESENYLYLAGDEWKKIFGDRYPYE